MGTTVKMNSYNHGPSSIREGRFKFYIQPVSSLTPTYKVAGSSSKSGVDTEHKVNVIYVQISLVSIKFNVLQQSINMGQCELGGPGKKAKTQRVHDT